MGVAYPFGIRRPAAPVRTYDGPPVEFNAILLSLVLIILLATGARAESTYDILALGDSLTAGYGLSRGDTVPVRLQAALGRVGISTQVQNAGVSGDTSSGGRARIDWLLDRRFDLVIVALGANDGLRGLDPALTRANLLEIIRRVRKTGARVLLAGMRAPPNLGRDYGRAFDALFPEIARTNGIAFYPFFLDGVAGRPDLNQPDGMHPNRKGVAIIVERMLPFVMKALGKD